MSAAERRHASRLAAFERVLPWIVAAVAVALLAGSFAWWRVQAGRQRTASAARSEPTPAELEQLLARTREWENEYRRSAAVRPPTAADAAVLRRAVDGLREWTAARRGADGDQRRRLAELETLLGTLEADHRTAESLAAEERARQDLAAGRRDEALAAFRAAWQAQVAVNRGPVRARRDLAREKRLAQEVATIEAEPLAQAVAAAVAEGERALVAQRWTEALAAFKRAREDQKRLNHDFSATRFAGIAPLERIETEIASLASADRSAEVDRLAAEARAAGERGEARAAAAGYAQAGALQQRIARDFPRSRFVSPERADELEIERQTWLTAEAAKAARAASAATAAARAAQAWAEVAGRAGAAAEAWETVARESPRSRWLDAEARAEAAFLAARGGELAAIAAEIRGQLRPLPGVPGVSMLHGEVPQSLYERIMGANPSRVRGARLPVESVSGTEADEFCRRLAWVLGARVRLPSEEEYRAAVGAAPARAAGAVWSAEVSGQRPREVAAAGAAADAGFADLLGNVAEWLRPAAAGATQAGVAGGSYVDRAATLLAVPVTLLRRDERSRTIGFRVVVETGAAPVER